MPLDSLIREHSYLVPRTAARMRPQRLVPGTADWDDAISAGNQALWEGCKAILDGTEIQKTITHYLVHRIKRRMQDAYRTAHRSRSAHPIRDHAELPPVEDREHARHLAVEQHHDGGLAQTALLAELYEVDHRLPFISLQLAKGLSGREIGKLLDLSGTRVNVLIQAGRQHLGGSYDAAREYAA